MSQIIHAVVLHEHNAIRLDCFYYTDSCFKTVDLITLTQEEIDEMAANDSIGGE